MRIIALILLSLCLVGAYNPSKSLSESDSIIKLPVTQVSDLTDRDMAVQKVQDTVAEVLETSLSVLILMVTGSGDSNQLRQYIYQFLNYFTHNVLESPLISNQDQFFRLLFSLKLLDHLRTNNLLAMKVEPARKVKVGQSRSFRYRVMLGLSPDGGNRQILNELKLKESKEIQDLMALTVICPYEGSNPPLHCFVQSVTSTKLLDLSI